MMSPGHGVVCNSSYIIRVWIQFSHYTSWEQTYWSYTTLSWLSAISIYIILIAVNFLRPFLFWWTYWIKRCNATSFLQNYLKTLWPGAISRNSKSFVWKFSLGKWLGLVRSLFKIVHNRPKITPTACVTKSNIIVSTFNFSSKHQHCQTINNINMFTYLGLSVSEILQSDYFPVYFQQCSHSISVRSVLISEFEEKQLLPSPRNKMSRFSQKALKRSSWAGFSV